MLNATRIPTLALILGCLACAPSPSGFPDNADHGSVGPTSDAQVGAVGAPLVFDATTLDLGEIIRGRIVTYTFRARHTGSSPLQLAHIHKSCGCSNASLYFLDVEGQRHPIGVDDAITPGAMVEIEAKFDSASKLGDSSTTISIAFRGYTDRINLTTNANVVEGVRVYPPLVEMGEVPRGDIVEFPLLIESRVPVAGQLNVERGLLPDGITAEVITPGDGTEVLEGSWHCLVRVDTALLGTKGPWSFQLVTVPSNSSGLGGATMPSVSKTVYIRGEVVDPVRCAPRFLAFGLVEHGQAYAKEATLIVDMPPPLPTEDPVVTVNPDPASKWLADKISVKWNRFGVQGDRPMLVTLDVPPDAPPGLFRGSLQISVSVAAEHSIRVDFSGLVSPGEL